ncbi:chemotaxis protein CheX [Caldalkalibacillus salinus]|uniref:chemotaxis protein CheX n=1 Tax=Caldalkalibacillus salinus TaxID=2803787 RepID=UPI001920D936|nr:chemotaxis protein CheX [Caldalkalibacillus salinus]
MEAQYINPFLSSAKMVLEQVIQVSPHQGKTDVCDVFFKEDHVWIAIGLTGQWAGQILFGIDRNVALRIVSVMMGGMTVTEFDDISKSAISELGNMISGNASVLLSTEGINIDITPPQLIANSEEFTASGKAISVPIELEDIGVINLQMIVQQSI